MSTKEIISYTRNIEVYKDDLFNDETKSIYLQFTNVEESTILLDSITNTNSLTIKIDAEEFLQLIKDLNTKIIE
jgi:molecular chaperone DnaK (HSP70)